MQGNINLTGPIAPWLPKIALAMAPTKNDYRHGDHRPGVFILHGRQYKVRCILENAPWATSHPQKSRPYYRIRVGMGARLNNCVAS